MQFSKMPWAVIAVVVIVLLLIGIVEFNSIARKDEAVVKAWTPLASALDLRYASVPALARAIVLYTGRDDETIKGLQADQQAYMRATTVATKAAAANAIEMDLNRIKVEAGQLYIGIESHYQFTELMDNFAVSQERMGPALAAYNAAVDAYNSAIRTFPSNLVALVCGFGRGAYVGKAGG